mmetsp:Transcript_34407/g.75137  ORF Transcript_34407/g.75137 Transcript_34407/m.75137 type:complete len:292 (-) Transcript_34407:289-1164(-)
MLLVLEALSSRCFGWSACEDIGVDAAVVGVTLFRLPCAVRAEWAVRVDSTKEEEEFSKTEEEENSSEDWIRSITPAPAAASSCRCATGSAESCGLWRRRRSLELKLLRLVCVSCSVARFCDMDGLATAAWCLLTRSLTSWLAPISLTMLAASVAPFTRRIVSPAWMVFLELAAWARSRAPLGCSWTTFSFPESRCARSTPSSSPRHFFGTTSSKVKASSISEGGTCVLRSSLSQRSVFASFAPSSGVIGVASGAPLASAKTVLLVLKGQAAMHTDSGKPVTSTVGILSPSR